MKLNRPPVIVIALGALSAALYLAAARLSDLTHDIVAFEILFFCLFALYLAAAAVAWRAAKCRRVLINTIIMMALVFRIIMVVPSPFLSNDVYRYAWEGRIQHAGYNPYAHTPDDPALAKVRASTGFELLGDSQSLRTVYQPAAQEFFFIAAWAGKDSVFVIKLLLSLIDIGTILILLSILRLIKRSEFLVLLYAWSPLVVFEVSGSGHIDGFTTFLVVTAAYFAVRNRKLAAGGLTGFAAAVKLLPIVLLPAFMNKREWKPAVGAAAAIAASYMIYVRPGATLLPFANGTAAGPHFNIGLKTLFDWLCGGPGPNTDNAYGILAVVLMGVACAVIWRRDKNTEDMIRGAFLLSVLLIILLPYTMPWYLLLVLPFAVLEVSPAFLYLSGAVMLSYLFYAWEPWHLPVWITIIEFVPFFLLLGFELFRRHARQLRFPGNDISSAKPTS